jgi:hypothetical protein
MGFVINEQWRAMIRCQLVHITAADAQATSLYSR